MVNLLRSIAREREQPFESTRVYIDRLWRKGDFCIRDEVADKFLERGSRVLLRKIDITSLENLFCETTGLSMGAFGELHSSILERVADGLFAASPLGLKIVNQDETRETPQYKLSLAVVAKKS